MPYFVTRRLQEIEEDADRRVCMLQDRLDSTINRYEEQLKLLRKQKGRLEDDLHQERRAGCKFCTVDLLQFKTDYHLVESTVLYQDFYLVNPLPHNPSLNDSKEKDFSKLCGILLLFL